MARTFLVPIDLNRNNLLNARMHASGTAPSTPNSGQMWWDTSNVVMKYYDGSTWVTFGTGSGGVTSVAGTANEIEVSGTGAGPYTGAVTVGLPNDVQITNNLTVGGDLFVTGDISSTSTTELLIEDNVIILNSTVTGAPTTNASLEINRGTSTDARVTWNETTDKWTAGLEGSEVEIALYDSSLTEWAQDAVGNNLVDSATIDFTYNDGAGTITAAAILATTSYLSGTSGLAVDIATLETKLTTDGYTKKYSASVGNGTLTSIAVTHSLNSRDVVVNVYDNSSYDTVECDVTRTDANTVTLGFSVAPTSNQYRVVVVG